MTNAQLRAEIQKYGENPPSRWTKAELQLRLEELSGTNAFVAAPKAKAEKSQYQQLVQDLNTANRRKDSLMEFCQNSLRLNVNKNMTMNQMRRDAMMAIYHRSQPDPTDVVGFGKHASLTYEEVKVHHKEYAKWVITSPRGDGHGPSSSEIGRLVGKQSSQGGSSHDHTDPKSRGESAAEAARHGGQDKECQDQGQQRGLRQQRGQCQQPEDRPVGQHDGADPGGAVRAEEGEGSTSTQDDDGDGEPAIGALLRDGDRAREGEGPDEPWSLEGLSDRNSQVRQPLSASQQLSQELSRGRARNLEEESWSVVPRIFESLVANDRPTLIEVTEDAQSHMTNEVSRLTGQDLSLSRCATWSGCDLRTGSGVKLALARLRLEKPRHLWIAMPCDAFSTCQNLIKRTDAQKQELAKRRREEHLSYIGASCLVYTCVQLGIHVSWVWPVQNQAWRLPVLRKLERKSLLHVGIARACRLGLRHPKTQKFLSQGWKIITSCERIAQALDLPCQCPKPYKHGILEGHRAAGEAAYPPELARRVAQVMLQEMSHPGIVQECKGQGTLPKDFGFGEFCVCSEVQTPLRDLRCGCCMGSHVISEGSQVTTDVTGDDDGEDDEVEVQDDDSGEAYGAWNRQCELIEVEAQRLTRSKDYSYQACENLVLQLPLKPKARHRNMLGDSEATYVLLGMYSHGNHYGITKKSARFPHTCRYLVECIRSWKQEPVEGTSLVLSVNNKLPLHKDNHNLPGTLNHVVGLGAYQGGGIWIESKLPGTESSTSRKVLANGHEVSGRDWPTRHQVVSFSGTSWHETEAWTGERVTLALYSSRGCAVVGSEVLDELRDLGFSPPKPPQASSLVAEYEQAHVVRQNRFSKAQASSGPKERESEREKRRERIRKQLYLLHSATGHGSKRVLLDALKRRGTSEEVLQLAREFRCSVCEERQQIHPRHLASLEVLPPKWHAISADIGHWRHPHTQEHVQFMLIIDQGSRFPSRVF